VGTAHHFLAAQINNSKDSWTLQENKQRPQSGVPPVHNLFAGLPAELPQEWCQDLLQTGHFRLERIVSAGQASPEGFWYDQPAHEWVALLSGGAGLKFADRPEVVVLKPGDHLFIPAGCRHRLGMDRGG